MPTRVQKVARFRELHASGTFPMPNPHDLGTARLYENAGFQALGTTSAGEAAALGRLDTTLTLDELLEHVAAMATAEEPRSPVA